MYNTFTVVRDASAEFALRDSVQLRSSFAESWLSNLPIGYGRFLRNINLYLDFDSWESDPFYQVMQLLGRALDPQVTFSLNSRHFTPHQLANPEQLPGISAFR